MPKKMSKRTGFVKKCFDEILSDGNTHTYAEICNYIAKQAEGTEFKGDFDEKNLAGSFLLFVKSDIQYQKVQRGVYQKMDYSQTSLLVLNKFRKLGRLTLDMEREMQQAFEVWSSHDKKKTDRVEKIYKGACENLKKGMEGITLLCYLYENSEVLVSAEDERTEEEREKTIGEQIEDEETEDYFPQQNGMTFGP